MGSNATDALTLIDEFEKRSGGTDWLFVKKEDLIKGLKKRLVTPGDATKSPNNINTSVVNLCGPGAFFRCLAMDDPVMYVRAVIALWETNSGLIGKRVFKASHSVRISKVEPGMDVADWVPLTSLRDDENIGGGLNPAGGVFGFTMPSAMKKWFTQAGYTDVKDETSVVAPKSLSNLNAADLLYSPTGHRVCFLIDSDVLTAANQNDYVSLYPDHWVTLAAPITIKDDKISTKVHSWGRLMPIPAAATLSLSLFLIKYYGYVSAKPA